MKSCTVCARSLPRDAFTKNSSQPDGLHYQCRECKRALHRKSAATDVGKASDLVRKRRRREAMRVWLAAYRAAHPCVVCGETEPCCLDFHHVEEKRFNIWEFKRLTWAQLHAEIATCVVLCANCHRKLHAGVICVPTGIGDTVIADDAAFPRGTESVDLSL